MNFSKEYVLVGVKVFRILAAGVPLVKIVFQPPAAGSIVPWLLEKLLFFGLFEDNVWLESYDVQLSIEINHKPEQKAVPFKPPDH